MSIIETLRAGGCVPRSAQAIATVAAELGIEQDVLAAFVEVEAAGSGYVGTGRHIKLLYEKHHFDRNVPAAKRAEARAAGLSRPNWISPGKGGYRDQPNNAAAMALFERAAAIDEDAALKSCSWGAGQIMGAHGPRLGYGSAADFVTKLAASEEEQIRAMGKFLEKANLIGAAKRKDWRALATGYNGKGQVDVYAPRLAKAYQKHAKLPDVPPLAPGEPPPVIAADPPNVLRRGMKSTAVKVMQTKLAQLGYPLEPDGDFGPATERLVREFQGANGLKADGIAGPATQAALTAGQPRKAEPEPTEADDEDKQEQQERDAEGVTALAADLP